MRRYLAELNAPHPEKVPYPKLLLPTLPRQGFYSPWVKPVPLPSWVAVVSDAAPACWTCISEDLLGWERP